MSHLSQRLWRILSPSDSSKRQQGVAVLLDHDEQTNRLGGLPEDVLFYIMSFHLSPKDLVSLSQTCATLRLVLHNSPLSVWRYAWERADEPLPPFPDTPPRLVLPALQQAESDPSSDKPVALRTLAYYEEDMAPWWQPLSGPWACCSEGLRCKTVYLRARDVHKSLGGSMPTVSRLLLHSPHEEPPRPLRMALSSSGDVAAIWVGTGINIWDLTLGFRYEISPVSIPQQESQICIGVFKVEEEYGAILVGSFLGEHRIDVLFQPLLSDQSVIDGAIAQAAACRVLLSIFIDPQIQLYDLQLSDSHLVVTICEGILDIAAAIVWVLDFSAGKQYAFRLLLSRGEHRDTRVIHNSLVIASRRSIMIGILCERSFYQGPSFAKCHSLFLDPDFFAQIPTLQQLLDVSLLGNYFRTSIYRGPTIHQEGAFPGTIKVFATGYTGHNSNLWLDTCLSVAMDVYVPGSDIDEERRPTPLPTNIQENLLHFAFSLLDKTLILNPEGKTLIQSLGRSNLSSPNARPSGKPSHISSIPIAGFQYTIECLVAYYREEKSVEWSGETNTLVITRSAPGQAKLQRIPLFVVDQVKTSGDFQGHPSGVLKQKPQPMTRTGAFGSKFVVQWHEGAGTMLSWNSTENLFEIYQFV
ncbi:hypothetical protein DL93DRAFT_2072825 [Clavulina sp. PMI_390]|nr:hypothetical protein DL93DRAFT_2072825 [Clavulina sp. PMI_390]